MSKFNYFPILKTTDSELNGFANLADEVKNNILPIFELTRSRRSKKNQEASINLRLEQLKQIVGNRPFILDLTTENDLSNREIDEMLTHYQNGYEKWVQLVAKLKNQGLNVIPIIHFNPYVLGDVKKEIQALEKLSPFLAFRVDVHDNELKEYLINIKKACSNTSNLIIILDGGFISIGAHLDNAPIFIPKIELINNSFFNMPKIVCSFSSFPPYVVMKDYGVDKNIDSFIISEFITEKNLPESVFGGDYGSVHPIRYKTGGGGTWIPRIDFIFNNKFKYYRYRREEGGYEKAAKGVLLDPEYSSITEIDTWGDQEILAAAGGYPGGLNPSHWISVRINLYITRHYLRLRKYPHMSL